LLLACSHASPVAQVVTVPCLWLLPRHTLTRRAVRYRSVSGPRLFAAEREGQTGNEEGQEKDRQDVLPGASKGDGLAVVGVEGLASARVSAAAHLQGVTSRFDRHLERVIHLNRSNALSVEHHLVRGTTDLYSDCLVGQLQRCGHR